MDNKALLIFLIGFVVRGALFLQVIDEPSVIFQPDSKMYTSLSEGIRRNLSFCYPDSPDQPDVERVPGYPTVLSAVAGVSGSYFGVIIFQMIIDSFSCLLVYLLAERFWKGTGLIAGLMAGINMGMIAYSTFILNDSIFLFAFLLSLFATVRLFDNPSWKLIVLTGMGIGGSAYIRPVVIYLPFLFMLFFLVYFLLTEKTSMVQGLGKSAAILFIFIVILLPWMTRGYIHYGKFRFTAQGGEHLLQYIVPFTWQYSKGIPFIDGMKQANLLFAEKMKIGRIDVDKLNPFEKSELQVEVALDVLRAEPMTAVIKAWLFGMIKNLFSPGIIDLSYLLGIERPHFFYTEGTTTLERAWNFVAGMKGWFGWAVIANIVVLVLSRVIQFWGLFLMMRSKPWEAMFFVLIIGYFLLVSGPVGYAKYRLPFEPILIVLMAIGLKDLWERWNGKRLRVEV